MFAFDALMESIMCGDTSIGAPANNAKERLQELARVNPATKITGYEEQFEVLCALILHTGYTSGGVCVLY